MDNILSPKAYVRVQREHILHNLHVLRQRAIPAQVMAILKGDAYGHGLEQVARWLADAGVSWIGLATVDEARELRAAGINTPIFLLYGPEPAEAAATLDLKLVSAVWRDDQVAALSVAATGHGTLAHIHLLVEISDNWLGIQPAQLDTFCSHIARLPGLEVTGICAHVWNADELQLLRYRFEVLAEQAQQHFPAARILHIANSVAVLRDSASHLDIVRPGIALFGIGDPELQQAKQIHAPLQTLVELPQGVKLGYTGRITERTSLIGVLAIGHSDGLDPGIVNGGVVLLKGQRCSIVSVGMGMTTIDVTAIEPPPKPGEYACLLGQQGKDCISIEEVAAVLNVTPYEVLTRFCAKLKKYEG